MLPPKSVSPTIAISSTKNRGDAAFVPPATNSVFRLREESRFTIWNRTGEDRTRETFGITGALSVSKPSPDRYKRYGPGVASA